MEQLIPEAPTAAAPKRPAPAYPTLGESWGILGWYLLVMVVVGLPLYLLFKRMSGLSPNVATISLTSLHGLALLGLLRWRAGKRWLPLQWTGQARLSLYAALPVLVLASTVVLSLLDFLHLPNWAEGAFQKMMYNPASALVALAVAAPVLEETLCRGVVLQGLLRSQQPWVAIGQSALLFGLLHFNPAQSVNAFLLGLLLGWLYYRTQSLVVCMVVHALHNSLWFAAMQWGPSAWQKDSVLETFGSAWVYAGAVGLSALALAAVLWWVQRTTAPPVGAPSAAAGEAAPAAAWEAAAA